ncbi:hypothetical protein [Lutibacter citreus]|uniref:hypothetical protein n=1 Tax=Lutibacter citreus TaxID=2138210 RepID=UPI000DBE69E7|nr:hypothetical protein [Lutibacter citreus]
MKKLIHTILFLSIIFLATNIAAQRVHKQNIRMLKTTYIANAISLTPSEAEMFWPIYNKFSNKLRILKFKLDNGIIQEINKNGGIDTLTEEQAQAIITEYLNVEKSISQTRIKRLNELNKIISAKKLILLEKAEKDFNKRMLQEYGKRKRMQEKQ